jgi:hypothetical protein
MSVWLTVDDLSRKLNCSSQYVRYLISGRRRIYSNRTTMDMPKIPESFVRVAYYGESKKRIKYFIHSAILQILIDRKQ